MEETREAPALSLPASAPAGGTRRRWVVALGAVELVFAAAALIAAVAIPTYYLLSPPSSAVVQAQRLERSVMAMVLLFLRTGALFVVLGWGMLRCRRWALAIQQVLFGLWLLQAVLHLPLTLAQAFSTRYLEYVRKGSHESLTAAAAGPLLFLGLRLLWELVAPFGLYLALRRPGARAVCEANDPVRRWTDACSPLMVTALVLMGLSAIDFLFFSRSFFVPAQAWFGLGLPNWPLRILLSAGLAALTVGVYRRSRRIAWATLIFLGAGTLLGIVRMAYDVAWQQLPGALQSALEPGSLVDRLLALDPWRPLVFMVCTLALWLVVLITLLPLPRSLAVVEEPETDASHFS